MTIGIGRRQFVSVLGAVAITLLVPARAQQPRRIGVLMADYAQTDREAQARIAAFLDPFQRLGWTDGHYVSIAYRWGAGNFERIKASAAELVHSAPDEIVVSGNVALAELHRLTSTIPIVFTEVGNPVDSGFVAGLARPGGNITGFQTFDPPMGGKWLQVLKEAVPNLSRAAVLYGSDAPGTVALLRAAEAAAPSLAITVIAVDVQDRGEIDRAVAAFAAQPDGGPIVTPHSYVKANRASIIMLAARYRLPAIYPFRNFATEGGLMSYGIDQIAEWRGAATYADRILRGEKPGELPVQAPTQYEMVINLKTAKALGIDVPSGLSARADEVIE